MSDLTIYDNSSNELVVFPINTRVDLAIEAWLSVKRNRTDSERTETAYKETLKSFRGFCRVDYKIDLDGNPDALSYIAPKWAGAGDRVAPATFNHRLAVVSSFYKYAKRHKLLIMDNPIDIVDRRKVQEYGSAMPMDAEQIKRALDRIDRNTLVGKRDYTLLAVALETGRRATELAGLLCGDLSPSGRRMKVLWTRVKGGEIMRDKLSESTTRSLIDYLQSVYGERQPPKDAAVWVSFSSRNTGGAISAQAIADICEKRIGTSKVHTLRHTFAHGMEKAGFPVSAIQAQLGHKSLATTGRYLQALNRGQGEHAEQIADLFGFK